MDMGLNGLSMKRPEAQATDKRYLTLAWWGIIGALGALSITSLLMLSPMVMPHTDVLGAYRALLLRGVMVIAFGWSMIWTYLLANLITPGCWLVEIKNGNVAVALWSCGFFMALALVLCFA